MLSLRVSRWRKASPSTTQRSVAASSRGAPARARPADTSPSERNGSGSASTSRQVWNSSSVRRGSPDGGVGRMDLVERSEDRVDVAFTPGRRPVRLAEVLEEEDRQLAVVVPAEERREESRPRPPSTRGARPGGSRGRLVHGDLRERARAVLALDEPTLHERVAPGRDAMQRPHAEPRPQRLASILHASTLVELRPHRDRAVPLVEPLESVALVQPHGR